MVKFLHHGVEWEARATGLGHGVGVMPSPPIDRWQVLFKQTGDPSREYRGWLSQEEPAGVPMAEIRSALDEQLVLHAIEDSQFTWRPAEAIGRETDIPVEEVRRILETTSADVIVRPEPNSQGYILYSTRPHYRKTTGFIKRYRDVLESS